MADNRTGGLSHEREQNIFAGAQAVDQVGFVGPAELPTAITARLHGEIVRILTSADVLKVLAENRLDVVAIRIEHEGAIVVRMVVRPQARRAVVLAAGRERGAMEGVDRGAVLGGEAEVQAGLQVGLHWLSGGAEPEQRKTNTVQSHCQPPSPREMPRGSWGSTMPSRRARRKQKAPSNRARRPLVPPRRAGTRKEPAGGAGQLFSAPGRFLQKSARGFDWGPRAT